MIVCVVGEKCDAKCYSKAPKNNIAKMHQTYSVSEEKWIVIGPQQDDRTRWTGRNVWQCIQAISQHHNGTNICIYRQIHIQTIGSIFFACSHNRYFEIQSCITVAFMLIIPAQSNVIQYEKIGNNWNVFLFSHRESRNCSSNLSTHLHCITLCISSFRFSLCHWPWLCSSKRRKKSTEKNKIYFYYL